LVAARTVCIVDKGLRLDIYFETVEDGPDHGVQAGKGDGEDLEEIEGIRKDPPGPAESQFCGWGNERSDLTDEVEDGYSSPIHRI
jgi:hypothetical protein